MREENKRLANESKTVLTIGTFDGVHLGHRAILEQVIAQAQAVGGNSVVVTFDPHPRTILFPNQPLQLLTSLNQRLDLLRREGIEQIAVVPFTKAFSQMEADAYVRDFLIEKFHPHTVVIGYDHHFGHGRSGNLELLKKYGKEYKFEVREISAQLIDEAAISSTKIRNALTAGEISIANAMLGRRYSLNGKVVEGDKLGRTIGYPTANMQPENRQVIIPANGVYAVIVEVRNNKHWGMLNIGFRPTVTNEMQQRIEAHLLDFNEDLYGENITIHLVDWIREEQKFDSLKALQEQLGRDKMDAEKILSESRN